MRTRLGTLDPVDERAIEEAVTHPVFVELYNEIIATPPTQAAGLEVVSMSRGLRRPLARPVLLMVVALVLTVFGVLAGTGILGGGGGVGVPFTTRWHEARPVEAKRSAASVGTWRLVNDLLTGTWQQNDYGPPPGYLSCAATDRCYVMSGRYPSAMAGAPLLSEALYVTSDQGATWTVLPMPSRFGPSSPLACAGSTWCAAGGTYQGQPVLLTTADGGHSFRVIPIPDGLGTLRSLTCPSVGACDGLVASSTGSDTGALDATFLTVTDGGTAFSDHPILSGDSMVALACASLARCTVVGQTDATENTLVPVGVVAVTSDAGGTWTAGRVPTGLGIKGMLSQLVCTDATHCVTTGRVAIKNAEQCPPTRPGASATAGPSLATIAMAPSVYAISRAESNIAASWAAKTQNYAGGGGCSSGSVTEVSVVATSSDGGLSWTPRALPGDVPKPQLNGLACPSATECWVSGSESIPQKIGSALDITSPMLLGTTNAGANWSKVTFSVAATAPNPTGQSYVTIGAISCPSASVCLAKGSGAQGADLGPVYSLVIPAG